MLEWLIENKSTGDDEDVIEDVSIKTLNTLIGNVDNLVVLFCELIQFTFQKQKLSLNVKLTLFPKLMN